MKQIALTLCLVLIGAAPAEIEAQHCAAVAAFSARDGAVTRTVSTLAEALVFDGGLRLNTDGAPNSYHPFGTAQGAKNTICNAIGVTPSEGPYAGQYITAIAPTTMTGRERCQTILNHFYASRDADWAILPSATIRWFAIAMKPREGNYGPCIQTEGQYAGFFVSTTALNTGVTEDVCDPAYWVDSNTIPYITLPSNNRDFANRDARPGDLALMHRRVGDEDRVVVAVVADRGNSRELGEGSLALHQALGREPGAGALSTIPDGVTTFLFPQRSAARPISTESLNAERDALIAALGGMEALLSCTPPQQTDGDQ